MSLCASGSLLQPCNYKSQITAHHTHMAHSRQPPHALCTCQRAHTCSCVRAHRHRDYPPDTKGNCYGQPPVPCDTASACHIPRKAHAAHAACNPRAALNACVAGVPPSSSPPQQAHNITRGALCRRRHHAEHTHPLRAWVDARARLTLHTSGAAVGLAVCCGGGVIRMNGTAERRVVHSRGA